jgi:hypothetical protein
MLASTAKPPKRVSRGASLFAAYALATAVYASPLAGATLDSLSLKYLPSRYSPGEEVFAQALLLPEGVEELSPFDYMPGAGLPDQGEEADPETRELRLAKTPEGWLLSLRFVPWSPGTGSVPSIRLGGIRIPSFPYSAGSILESDAREPSPPRRQRDPPGTALYLYALAGILIVIMLGAMAVAAYLVPAARALIARRRSAQAFKRFSTSLEFLEAEAESAKPAIFFAALSRAFRLYIASRALPDFSALTAPEIEELPETALPAPATKDKAAAFIAHADKLRYGAASSGETIARSALASAIEEARAIVEANEEALRARL